VHFIYLGILAACLLGTLPLEFVFRARVYARWPRVVLTLLPVVVAFGAWDIAEISAGAWSYDARYVVGITLPGRLPLEELLFFVVIPICSLLTFEAVRAVRPAWDLRAVDADPAPTERGRPAERDGAQP
jgi:lycopene cyclase domain-containing protein